MTSVQVPVVTPVPLLPHSSRYAHAKKKFKTKNINLPQTNLRHVCKLSYKLTKKPSICQVADKTKPTPAPLPRPSSYIYKDPSVLSLNSSSPAFFWFFLAIQTHILSLSLSLSLLCSYVSFSFFLARQELANPQETLEETDSGNQRVVRALYEALNSRDVEKVHSLLSPDLDWWFHGPPSHQFLMRLLTGAKPDDVDQTSSPPFRFDPQSFASFGPTVIVEGCDYDRSIAWVHAWTVTDGIITQVREYLNTSLTVTRLGNSPKSSPSSYSSSSSSTAEIASYHCPSVWESSLSDRVGKSVPGLVLAI